jgi:hypothetical protein
MVVCGTRCWGKGYVDGGYAGDERQILFLRRWGIRCGDGADIEGRGANWRLTDLRRKYSVMQWRMMARDAK